MDLRTTTPAVLGALLLSGCELIATVDRSQIQEYPSPRSNVGIVTPDGAMPEGFVASSAKLRLQFDSQDIRSSTRQLVLIMREVPPMGDGCDQLWADGPTALQEGLSVIDFPDEANGKLVAGNRSGPRTLIVYAMDSRFDLLCQTDEWCADSTTGPKCLTDARGVGRCAAADATQAPAPIGGGCQQVSFTAGAVNEYTLPILPPPGR